MAKLDYLKFNSITFRCFIIFLIFVITYDIGFQLNFGTDTSQNSIFGNLGLAILQSTQRAPITMVLFAHPGLNLVVTGRKTLMSKLFRRWFNQKMGQSTIARIIYLIVLFTGFAFTIECGFNLLGLFIKPFSLYSHSIVAWQESVLFTLASLISIIVIEGKAPEKR